MQLFSVSISVNNNSNYYKRIIVLSIFSIGIYSYSLTNSLCGKHYFPISTFKSIQDKQILYLDYRYLVSSWKIETMVTM